MTLVVSSGSNQFWNVSISISGGGIYCFEWSIFPPIDYSERCYGDSQIVPGTYWEILPHFTDTHRSEEFFFFGPFVQDIPVGKLFSHNFRLGRCGFPPGNR
uniref:(northern house mosquito) hypothetical protein n=1 Tax=Culex pipiens TaxID=7175 RepID=A0A8D8A1X4_CULPI